MMNGYRNRLDHRSLNTRLYSFFLPNPATSFLRGRYRHVIIIAFRKDKSQQKPCTRPSMFATHRKSGSLKLCSMVSGTVVLRMEPRRSSPVDDCTWITSQYEMHWAPQSWTTDAYKTRSLDCSQKQTTPTIYSPFSLLSELGHVYEVVAGSHVAWWEVDEKREEGAGKWTVWVTGVRAVVVSVGWPARNIPWRDSLMNRAHFSQTGTGDDFYIIIDINSVHSKTLLYFRARDNTRDYL